MSAARNNLAPTHGVNPVRTQPEATLPTLTTPNILSSFLSANPTSSGMFHFRSPRKCFIHFCFQLRRWTSWQICYSTRHSSSIYHCHLLQRILRWINFQWMPCLRCLRQRVSLSLLPLFSELTLVSWLDAYLSIPNPSTPFGPTATNMVSVPSNGGNQGPSAGSFNNTYRHERPMSNQRGHPYRRGAKNSNRRNYYSNRNGFSWDDHESRE